MTITRDPVHNGSPGIPSWLGEDMERVENLLSSTAGASAHPLVSEASTHLINAGGKRIRPALVLLTSRAGESGRSGTDLAAAGIELIHLATLYHDDVIDDTDTRRGVPTAHSKWGVEVAVLAGDYLFASGCALGARAGGRVPVIIAGALAEVCEGQIAETAIVGDPRRSVDDYYETIHKKTAALFRGACELGTETSGAGDEATRALSAYGVNLGLAFQLVDDLLDLVGDPQVTGKSPGTDLREGVFTMPVLLGCERDPSLAERLLSGERDVDTVLPALEKVGALDDSLRAARDHGLAAERALESFPGSQWVDALHSLVSHVLAQIN